MANNIEKLYELAEVEKITFSTVIQGEFPHRIHDRCYHPFTHKKAVGLNNWLLNNQYKKYIQLVDKKTSYYELLKFDNKEEEKKFIKNDAYQSLAGLVCELWEDLSDEQREEVRGILQ